MQEQQKVKISERAVIARIRRKLAKNGETLGTYRGVKYHCYLGNFYVADVNTGCVVDANCTVAGLAEELGVLKPWEEIEA